MWLLYFCYKNNIYAIVKAFITASVAFHLKKIDCIVFEKQSFFWESFSRAEN